MNYGNQNIDYALRAGLIDAVDNSDDYADASQLQYSRKRSVKALRKRSSKRRGTSTPGCGIAARCNRRYVW